LWEQLAVVGVELDTEYTPVGVGQLPELEEEHRWVHLAKN
jgi:hypothetical protein